MYCKVQISHVSVDPKLYPRIDANEMPFSRN